MSEELSRWYRNRLVGGPFTSFDEAEWDALERAVGLLIPTAYRTFLEEAGGRRLEYAICLPECEPEPLQSFHRLYRLGRDDTGEYGPGTLLGQYRRSRDSWLAGEVSLEGLLPIARDSFDDFLYLDLNLATHGQLRVFVHGIPIPGYLTKHVFTTVATDFGAYLDSLSVDPSLAEDRWSEFADSDPSDPWRTTVEEWLDRELPGWRSERWATARDGS